MAVATKLLVKDKTAACIKKNLLGVVCVMFSKEKHSLLKHFHFLKNVCYLIELFVFSNLLFLLLLLFFFFSELLIDPQQLSWNVSLFSCNPIGQLCLGGPLVSSGLQRYTMVFPLTYSNFWNRLFRIYHYYNQPPHRLNYTIICAQKKMGKNDLIKVS